MFKRFRLPLCLIVLSVLVFSLPVVAQDKPIQISLFNPLQIFPEATSITGLRINFIYGKNVTVKGLDIGLVNHNTGGLSKGLQWGFVGIVDADFLGWQNNTVNIVKGRFEGFQSGWVNSAKHASGFQLGLVNYAETMYGLQIGLINIIKQNGAFPVFPIINWSF